MVKLNKKQLLRLATELGADDITTADPHGDGWPVYRDKIAFSYGADGMTALLVRDDNGRFYFTHSHCSNNYILM